AGAVSPDSARSHFGRHERRQRGILSVRGDGDVHEAARERGRYPGADRWLDRSSRMGIGCGDTNPWIVSRRRGFLHAAEYAGSDEGGRAARTLTAMPLSRAIFREYDIRGVAGKDLTEDVATAVAGAYAAFLAEKGVSGALAIGRDNRPSGGALHRALVAALLASGLDIVDIGIVPTPLAYWSQHNLEVVGGIQITGSHNPPEYNGFKLGLGTNSIYGADIQHIYELAVTGRFPRGKGVVRHEQIIDRY